MGQRQTHMANTTISIAISEKMKAYVEERVASGDFGNVSEFFRHLVREDAKRAAEERLVALLLEGEESGEPIRVDEAWWDQRREELLQKARAARKKRA